VDERIEAIQRRTARDRDVIGLAGGLPSEVQFPKRKLARSFFRVLGREGTPALQYGWAEGFERLRTMIAAHLRARRVVVTASDVIITSGAQQAIAIGLELVCKPGDRVGVAAETYPAALDLIRERGMVPVAAADRVRALYAMPALGNPSGLGLSPEARRALLAAGVPVIEDDAYADLRFDGPAPPPLLADAPSQVIYVGTLSKTLCPGLRIGWLVVPARLRRRALRLKQGSDLHASSLSQAIVEDLLGADTASGGLDFEAHLVRLRRFYRTRAMMLARALRQHLPGWRFATPEGGFAIWAQAEPTRRKVDEKALLEAAAEERVMFDPGSLFRPDKGTAPIAARFCFSATPPAMFEEGIRRMARAWQRVTSEPRRRRAADVARRQPAPRTAPG
jgi:2-aminoadipate transaminase